MSEFVTNLHTSLKSSWSNAPREGDIENDHVKEDLETLLKDLAIVDVATKAMPIDLTTEDIEKVKEEMHNFSTSFVRAAATFKNLPSPLSPEEGLDILPIIQDIQTCLIGLMGECTLRLPQAEAEIPGYGDFFSIAVRDVIDPYYESLASVAPSTIPQSLVQEMKNAADAAIQDAISSLISHSHSEEIPYSLDSTKNPEPINLTDNTPDTHLSTTFYCDSNFDGRLTPLATPMQHVLDFILKDSNIRYKNTTDLRVFYTGVIGEMSPILVEPVQPDVYVLNSKGMYEIRSSEDYLISQFSFIVTKLKPPPERSEYRVIFH